MKTKFDKSRVYTALNADELKVGSEVYVSDNMYYLKKCVEDNLESCILTEVLLEKEANRFCIDKSNEQWQLAYLIEPPAEPKYEPFESIKEAMDAIRAHGGWVKDTISNRCYAIVAYDEATVETEQDTFGVDALFDGFVFADDGSPCGELVEE